MNILSLQYDKRLQGKKNSAKIKLNHFFLFELRTSRTILDAVFNIFENNCLFCHWAKNNSNKIDLLYNHVSRKNDESSLYRT